MMIGTRKDDGEEDQVTSTTNKHTAHFKLASVKLAGKR